MSWANFFKSKEDEEYDQFLMNPQEVYQKLKEEFELKDKVNDSLVNANTELQEKVKELDENLTKEIESFYKEQAMYLDKIDKLKIKTEDLELTVAIEKELLFDKFRSDKRDMIAMYQDKYEMSVAKRKAELEKDYYHEIHMVIEAQYEKHKEMIPSIIRETIIGFHNGTD